MKRHPALQPLSDEHHGALVLARRLRRLPEGMDPPQLAALWREVRHRFEDELEPHFHVEEGWLLPRLAARGARVLVDRTADDHARLRALIQGPGSEESARELGRLLAEHVRFEERVLFPEAEALLGEPELAVVRDAARASSARAGGAQPSRSDGA